MISMGIREQLGSKRQFKSSRHAKNIVMLSACFRQSFARAFEQPLRNSRIEACHDDRESQASGIKIVPIERIRGHRGIIKGFQVHHTACSLSSSEISALSR